MDLETLFQSFSKFGDPKSNGKAISLRNVDKWMKQANVVDGKILTTADTGIYFKKFKVKSITYKQFLIYLDDLSHQKKLDVEKVKNMLKTCGSPRATFPTQILKVGGVERLTDPSHFTGIHRERFSELDKGMIIEDKDDIIYASGFAKKYKKSRYNVKTPN